MKKYIIVFVMLISACASAKSIGTSDQKIAYAKRQLNEIAERQDIKLIQDSVNIVDQKGFLGLPNIADFVADDIMKGTEDFQYVRFLVKTDSKYLKGNLFLFSSTKGSGYEKNNITKETLIDVKSGVDFSMTISTYGPKKTHQEYETFDLGLQEIY